MKSSPYLCPWLPLIFLAVFLTTVSAIPFNTTRLQGRQFRHPEIVSKAFPEDFKTFFYEQTLDHFNYKPESYRTFRQRYVMFDKYWDEGDGAKSAPIFAYLGDENLLDSRIGSLQTHARSFKALLVYMEHRYYGKSIPFEAGKESFRDPNFLGYLNSAQALADYAEILIHIKEKHNAHESPIIAVGGSYGGMLASWFRLKYPHIALGALASSAPILYFDDIKRQNKVTSMISEVFKEVGENCYETIKHSWSGIDGLASTSEGLKMLSHKFKTCRTLSHSFELKSYLESMYMNAAKSGRALVEKICRKIDDNKEDGILNKISAAVIGTSDDDKTCFVNPESVSYNAWKWQRCSEIVMTRSQDSETMFEPVPSNQMDLLIKECHSLYSVIPRLHSVPNYYGGGQIPGITLILKRFASNIIFYNGLKDPYSLAGVLENLSNTIHAVVRDQGGHCEDIFPNENTNKEWLHNVIETEFNIIQGWLIEYNKDLKSLSDN